jgi:hypothetical protein
MTTNGFWNVVVVPLLVPPMAVVVAPGAEGKTGAETSHRAPPERQMHSPCIIAGTKSGTLERRAPPPSLRFVVLCPAFVHAWRRAERHLCLDLSPAHNDVTQTASPPTSPTAKSVPSPRPISSLIPALLKVVSFAFLPVAPNLMLDLSTCLL